MHCCHGGLLKSFNSALHLRGGIAAAPDADKDMSGEAELIGEIEAKPIKASELVCLSVCLSVSASASVRKALAHTF